MQVSGTIKTPGRGKELVGLSFYRLFGLHLGHCTRILHRRLGHRVGRPKRPTRLVPKQQYEFHTRYWHTFHSSLAVDDVRVSSLKG